jgi:hypothetical protein
MIKRGLILVSMLSTLSAVEMPPMPPSAITIKAEKSSIPDSCRVIPPMLRQLPPPMEIDFEKCRNDINLPENGKILKLLKKSISRDVSVKSIEVAEDFNMLYKVSYQSGKSSGVVYCNKKATKCIKDNGVIGD